MIRFACECGRQLQAREELAGRAATCPGCGARVPIPGPGTAWADGPPPRPEPVAVQVERTGADHVEREGRRPRRRREEDEDEGRFREPAATSGKATASLVLGLSSFVCLLNVLTGIPAVVLGALALKDINGSRGKLGGQGLAIGGIATGILGVLMLLPALLAIPVVIRVREEGARQQSVNNLKQIGVAMHRHHDVHGAFPPAGSRSPAGKPLLSWRVHLLPHLKQDGLYKRFKLDEPWDSEHNKALLPLMPKVYLLPGKDAGPGMTYYRVFTGPRTPFDKPGGVRMAEITDGTMNTILVAEAAQAVPWTKPDEELPFTLTGPLPALGGHRGSGFNALFADGSVRTIRPDTPDATLRALITRDGGEVYTLP